jgi:ABC-type nitrate/sulfonate/bicarbonate transport system ATPase subunit
LSEAHMSNIVLKVTNLSFQRPQKGPLFENVNFQIEKGQVCGIIGPSGIGKSTLLRMVSGLGNHDEKQVRGSRSIIVSDGENDYDPDEALSQGLIAVYLQDPMLFPWLTVLDNCLWVTRVRRGHDNQTRERAQELLKEFYLTDTDVAQQSSTLSDGQKQRVALVRALVSARGLLVLDEPFSSMDIHTKYKDTNHVRQAIRQNDWAALHVAHDERDIVRLCDTVYVLKRQRWEDSNGPSRLTDPEPIGLSDDDRWDRTILKRERPLPGNAPPVDYSFYSQPLNGIVNRLLDKHVRPR